MPEGPSVGVLEGKVAALVGHREDRHAGVEEDRLRSSFRGQSSQQHALAQADHQMAAGLFAPGWRLG